LNTGCVIYLGVEVSKSSFGRWMGGVLTMVFKAVVVIAILFKAAVRTIGELFELVLLPLKRA
jgi:hypothetical protein